MAWVWSAKCTLHIQMSMYLTEYLQYDWQNKWHKIIDYALSKWHFAPCSLSAMYGPLVYCDSCHIALLTGPFRFWPIGYSIKMKCSTASAFTSKHVFSFAIFQKFCPIGLLTQIGAHHLWSHVNRISICIILSSITSISCSEPQMIIIFLHKLFIITM